MSRAPAARAAWATPREAELWRQMQADIALTRKITDKGYTIVPLALYFKDGRAKVEIALAKGKKSYDKRHTLAERTANREKVEAVQRRLKGHRD